VELLEKLGVYGIPLAAFFAWCGYSYQSLIYPANPAFPRRIASLRSRDYSDAYVQKLSTFLRLLDRCFGECVQSGKNESDSIVSIINCALTPRSHEVLLSIAALYPIAFLNIGWVLSNTASLGSFELIRSTSGNSPIFVYLRALFCLMPVLVFWFMYSVREYSVDLATQHSFPRHYIISITASYIVIGFFTIALTVAIAGVGFGVYTTAIAFVFTVTVVKKRRAKLIGPGAITLAGVLSVLVVIPGATERYSPAYTPAAVAVLIVLLLIGGVYVLRYSLLAHNQFKKHVVLLVFSVACMWIAYSLGDSSTVYWTRSQMMVLFLCILPLLNSPIDWVSLGFKRGLLEHLANVPVRNAALICWGIVDAVVAVLLLFVITTITIASIWFMNALVVKAGGEPIVRLNSLLLQMASGDWQEKMWIWMLLGSTLLPTSTHFILAMLALGFYKNHDKTKKMADLLQQSRNDALKFRDSPQDAAVLTSDFDARKFAFIHLYIYPILLSVFSVFIIAIACIFLFKYLPSWMYFILRFLG